MEIDRNKIRHYVRSSIELDGGKKRRVIDCNDEVAQMLRDKYNDAELEAVAREHGLEDQWKRWSHLSRGQRRMNLGNVLRGKLRRAARNIAA